MNNIQTCGNIIHLLRALALRTNLEKERNSSLMTYDKERTVFIAAWLQTERRTDGHEDYRS